MFKKRVGTLDDEDNSHIQALRRLPVSKYIAENYVVLASLSSYFQYNTPLNNPVRTLEQQKLVDLLKEKNILIEDGRDWVPTDQSAAQYLSGFWLEELAWAAALEAGADAAVYSQHITWGDDEFNGQNEIDVIAAFGDHITFISCKALRPHINPSKDQSRYKNLRMALHEADDLADHFGIEGDRVIYLTTVDMIHEAKDDAHRMPSLAGKAKALDVQIIGLEQIGWVDLVAAINSQTGS